MLKKDFNDFLKILSLNAQKQGVRLFFVGGCVRDEILNKKTKDFDLIVDTNAIEFCKKIKELKIKSIHEDFKTVKVIYKNNTFDIASTRLEKYPYSGCLPEVTKTGVKIEQDVLRRDFTINSLYKEIKLKDNKLSFEIIDLTDGLKDIKNKTLKVLHKNSYIDDPTRILRGLDFKHRFNFDFTEYDITLIKDYLKNPNLKNASTDRIKSVLLKILSSKNNKKIFKDILDYKIYKLINKNLKYDLENIEKTVKKFKLKDENLAQFYYFILSDNQTPLFCAKSKTDIVKNFEKLDISNLAYYFYKTQDKNALVYLKLKDIKLLIKGEDLIKLNYPQGKTIGKILSDTLEEKLKNPQNFKTKKQEIAFVKSKFQKT